MYFLTIRLDTDRLRYYLRLFSDRKERSRTLHKPGKGERRTEIEQMRALLDDLDNEVLIDPSGVMEATAPHDDGDDSVDSP